MDFKKFIADLAARYRKLTEPIPSSSLARPGPVVDIDAAHEIGRAEGYEVGRKAGYEVGHAEGYGVGYNTGYDEGFQIGLEAKARPEPPPEQPPRSEPSPPEPQSN